jgi:hypothetical protein
MKIINSYFDYDYLSLSNRFRTCLEVINTLWIFIDQCVSPPSEGFFVVTLDAIPIHNIGKP